MSAMQRDTETILDCSKAVICK